MKEKVLLVTVFIIVLFSQSLLNAQSFTFHTEETTKVALINSEIIFDFPVINTSSSSINVVILRRSETIPSTWSGTMCFGVNCFPPTVDSVESEQIAAGDTVDYSYHFFTDDIVSNGTVVLVARDSRNASDSVMVTLNASTITGIINNSQSVYSYRMEQNYPNPFNPSTKIFYSLPSESKINITVYNTLGETVKELFSGFQQAGNHEINFNAEALTSGVYFYEISAFGVNGNEQFRSIKKMLLLR